MKRILFFTIPEKGHINPMIGPAVWLQRLGHEVRFHAAHDISAQLYAAGLQPLDADVPAAPPLNANRGAFFAEKVRDKTWLREWIHRLLIEEAPAQIPGYAQAIAAFQPDLIVTDPMIYPAAIAAHQAMLPWVALSNSLNPVLDDTVKSDLLDTVASLGADRDALFKKHGLTLRFGGCDMLSPYLTVAFTTREFIGRDVSGVEMVGPSLPPATRGDEVPLDVSLLSPTKKKIFMSFGSQIYHQPELFQKVIRVTAPMDVQLILSVNALLGTPELGDLPPHVLALPYVPQLRLLPHVDAFITHGGANSVMEALHFGVPMLISPVCNDQFHQAHFLERAQAGQVLDLTTASEAEVTICLSRLLFNPQLKERAKALQTSYAVDGAKRAAELIAAL
ncbi:MAG: glycosyltransferase [Verrucomicrobiota bacterium]